MRSLNLLFLLSVILSGCNADKPVSNAIQFSKTKEITIKMDSSESAKFYTIQAFQDGSTPYVIVFDYIFQSINIYDLNQVRLIKRISVAERSKYPLKIDAIHFHNFDSIFIFHRYPSNVFLIDSVGFVKRQWEVNRPIPGRYENFDYLLEVSVMSKHADITDGGKTLNSVIFFNVQPTVKSYSQPVMSKFDLDKGEVSHMYGHNPVEILELMLENRFYGVDKMYPSFVVKDSTSVLSYPFDHYITVYDNENDSLVRRAFAKSRYVDEFVTSSLEYEGAEKAEKLMSEEPSYHDFIYDKYRGLYYRVVKHKQFYKDDSGLKNNYGEAPWSIIVLDKNLAILAEIPFPSDKYDFTSVFIIQQGLLVRLLDGRDFKFELFDITEHYAKF